MHSFKISRLFLAFFERSSKFDTVLEMFYASSDNTLGWLCFEIRSITFQHFASWGSWHKCDVSTVLKGDLWNFAALNNILLIEIEVALNSMPYQFDVDTAFTVHKHKIVVSFLKHSGYFIS